MTSTVAGLSTAEVRARLERYGPNRHPPPLRVLETDALTATEVAAICAVSVLGYLPAPIARVSRVTTTRSATAEPADTR